MELNTLETEMLIDIYDADMLPEMPFEFENYKLIEEDPKNKKQEFAFHLKKLKRLGQDSAALYLLDTELAARVFVPPVI